jgi:hypothetical protein
MTAAATVVSRHAFTQSPARGRIILGAPMTRSMPKMAYAHVRASC